MNEILQGKDLVRVAEEKVYVTRLKGPLEDGWQEKVNAFVGPGPETAPRAVSAHRRAPRRQPSAA